jgi:hypothetical protein
MKDRCELRVMSCEQADLLRLEADCPRKGDEHEM